MPLVANPSLDSIETSANLSSAQFGIDSVNSVCVCLAIGYVEICPELNSINIYPTINSVVWELGISSVDTMISIDSVDLKPFNGV